MTVQQPFPVVPSIASIVAAAEAGARAEVLARLYGGTHDPRRESVEEAFEAVWWRIPATERH